MFIFDLFEKSKDLYNRTQNAAIKRGIEQGRRLDPSTGKDDTAAVASWVAGQQQDLDQEKEQNARQEKEIKALNQRVSALSKATGTTTEPAPVAKPTQTFKPRTGTPIGPTAQAPAAPARPATPAPVARVAGAPRLAPSTLPATQPSNVLAMPTATTATAPAQATTAAQPAVTPAATPAGRVVSPADQLDQYKEPEPTTSTALGQMAQTLAPPEEELPFKGKGYAPSTAGIFGVGGSPKQRDADAVVAKKDQTTAEPTAQAPDEKPDYSQLGTIGQLIQGPWGTQGQEEPMKKVANMREGAEPTTSPAIGSMVNQLSPGAPQTYKYPPAIDPVDKQIQDNAKSFGTGKLRDRDARLYYGPANVTVPAEEVARIWEYVMVKYPNQAEQLDAWKKIFSNLNVLRTIRQLVGEIQQSLPIKEGDVIPMTGQPQVPAEVKAYQYALEILKSAFNPAVPTAKVDQMKQILFHDFQARIQQKPDGAYYLNFNNGRTQNLPDPRTFPMEEGAMNDIDIGRQDLQRLTDQQFLKAYGISKEFWKYRNQAVLKKPARRPMSPQLAKSAVGQKMSTLYGQTCPGCGNSINPDRCVCEDSWSAGDNAWSSEHNNWTAEAAGEPVIALTGVDEDRLHTGDPVVVTAPNEFEGKTGEIEEFSPSGKFVIVNLYNHGRHSMHLSDVEYNHYADEVDEGYQDFKKVEPYAVCLAGKPVKKFDYYEQARQFHDNWKKKLYNQGDKAKADKITLMPIMDEDSNDFMANDSTSPVGGKVDENVNYWEKLQRERDQRKHARAYGLLESLQDVFKDIK